MELSWLLDTDGSETWTLLDNRNGHRNFDNEADARTEFARRRLVVTNSDQPEGSVTKS